jgi:cation diffusion facilitator CzcD-associated flavoprotein CzcO
VNTIFRDVCDVAIVGAGPYGLSLASHLKAAKVDTRIFGDPLSFWRQNMPQGMQVRSAWDATHIVDPHQRFTLDAYAAASGLGKPDPLPREDFVRYGDWFQRSAVPDLDRRKVARIDATEGGFLLRLDDGQALGARRVVVAAGLANQAYRPSQFAALPSELVSHTCDHSSLASFRGRRVAVIGCGQSGCEGAALLNEAGAEVDIISRDPIHWLGAGTSGHLARRDLYWRLHKMLSTRSGVGPFPLNWLNEAPEIVHRLPKSLRAAINAMSLRPGAAGWIKPRLGGVHIDSGRVVFGARQSGERIILDLDNGSREFDHVMLATGYRIDVARFGFLGPDLLKGLATDHGSPILSQGYESSVHGLHFIGASAVGSFGPLLRFVWGAGYAARGVTTYVLARRPDRSSAPDLHADIPVRAREDAASPS